MKVVKPGPSQLGTPDVTITLAVDSTGLMCVSVAAHNPLKPVTVFDVINLFLDAIQSQREMLKQQAQLLINPNRAITTNDPPSEKKGNGADQP